MTTLAPDSVLSISTPVDMNASTVHTFREKVRASLLVDHTQLDVDMSNTTFLDSSGLGALLSFHKLMTARGGKMRVINPRPAVVQIIELTRVHRIIEISHH
jgi:anti-sigma B factor antagonist